MDPSKSAVRKTSCLCYTLTRVSLAATSGQSSCARQELPSRLSSDLGIVPSRGDDRCDTLIAFCFALFVVATAVKLLGCFFFGFFALQLVTYMHMHKSHLARFSRPITLLGQLGLAPPSSPPFSISSHPEQHQHTLYHHNFHPVQHLALFSVCCVFSLALLEPYSHALSTVLPLSCTSMP